ncbi:PHO85 cyclin-like protein psl1 [Schizosaccharomyces pombe]|uniref:PHO85 cyclin-like protein psl1 n=1 Tax=Schizosaccharomyces pombe (strain 972 / ATCC 24843) TaxID=284812 RepID=PSL1_SCHPO|nr:putative pho85 family cyclin [Schizosaccharomyces pombe]O42979.1 RecName: Full=PHO85 cyclin-like protein psl1 [Schizosaccharomyces pombe 972h-]CAA16850.1 cyclin pho85 family (predicted) [Schizosaccharomyces pombe]|eukprot:NP_596374.1 putative pho85 family cyclin [Schizosaccharomyces pombe]
MSLAFTLLTSKDNTDEDEEHLELSSFNQEKLLEMISVFLSRLTRLNDSKQEATESDQIPLSPTSLKNPCLIFSAKNVPSISIQAYLTRILKYCPATNDVFLSVLIYLDRIVHHFHFTVFINSFNIHRFLIAGFTAASKFFSDVFYTNSRYAKVGGIPLHELNHLELSFFVFNDFNLFISLEDLQAYGDLLLSWYRQNGQNYNPTDVSCSIESPISHTPQQNQQDEQPRRPIMDRRLLSSHSIG